MKHLAIQRFLSLALVLSLAAALAPSQARTRVVGRATYGYGHHRGGVHLVHHGYHYGHRYHGHRHRYGFGYYGWPGYYVSYGRPATVYVASEAGSARRIGAIETDVRPKKAQVLLDGQPVGQVRDFNGPWDLLYVPAGSHSIEFAAPGHMTLRVSVEVRSGAYYRLEDRLLEGSGEDPRSDPPPAEPPPPPEAQEPAGAEPATRPAATLAAARPGEAPPPPPGLKQGRLHISATPADAAVYLDGEFLARAGELERLHGAIPVAQGTHTVEAVRPGYESDALEVNVREEPEHVRIELRPKD